ncbi:MAG: AAA domain-containing protein [Lachnospiraceae bacterium]|nr:AAA domain-containing protein [Lachnospiraceae bacterium]
MELTREMHRVMERGIRLAQEGRHRYFMPEHMLYGMTFDEGFSQEYEAGGGSVEKLRLDLKGFLDKQAGTAREGSALQVTSDAEQVFAMMGAQARSSGRKAMDVSHLLAAVMELEDCYGLYFLAVQEVDLIEVIGELSRLSLSSERDRDPSRPGLASKGDPDDSRLSLSSKRKRGMEEQLLHLGDEADVIHFSTDSDQEEFSFAQDFEEDPEFYEEDWEEQSGGKSRWKRFLEDMNEACERRNPLIGRQEEMERTLQILCRKDKNNVLHIGDPGVGKTALAYGLARLIRSGQVPEPLLGAHVYSLDMGSLLAGTQYRGDFEKRFKEVMEGLETEKKPILYVDEIHMVVGAGAVSGGSLDAANMLKPYLEAGHIRFIGSTTFEEYKKHFSSSKSLVRRFGNVEIQEPSQEEAVEILKGLKAGYESFHGVKYRPGVLEHAVEVSSRHMQERFLPDKAIDLIDEAGAYRRLHPLEQKSQTVNKALIDQVLARICSIPVQTVEKGETEKLAALEGRIKKVIFGQDEAVSQVVNAVKFSRAGLNEERQPIASFLFVGATGVGKTELARALASELGISFLRYDMSEYAERHAVAKLIGAPAGYVGYEEGGILTEEIRRHPHAVLLLDEIEKAHSDIYNVLLQVMDYATLTDNQGRKADFRNIILIMTSNAGAAQVGKSQIGFGSAAVNLDALKEAVKRTFQPEFRNRLSRMVLFRSMDEEMAGRITEKKLGELKKKLEARKVELTVTQEAAEYIRTAGITREYGAREIDRVISARVKPLLAEVLLFGRLKKGGACVLDLEQGGLVLR